MVKTKREYIFATFATSGIALVLSLVSIGSQSWITSDVSTANAISEVNYGLFFGSYERKVGTLDFIHYDLKMTCLMSENICAMLCDGGDLSRSEVLEELHQGNTPGFNCAIEEKKLKDEMVDYASRADTDRSFINSALWICTILFFAIGCLFGIFSTLLAMWNSVYDPVNVYFNVRGLFICNAVACSLTATSAILWGVQFGITLVDNVVIYDTIVEPDRGDDKTMFGYSYWLNLTAVVLYGASMVLVAVRRYLINRNPPITINLEKQNDNSFMFF